MLTGSLFSIRPQTPLWLLVLLKTCQSKTTVTSKTTGFSIRNCILFFEKHIQLDEHEWQEIDLGLHSFLFCFKWPMHLSLMLQNSITSHFVSMKLIIEYGIVVNIMNHFVPIHSAIGRIWKLILSLENIFDKFRLQKNARWHSLL